MFIFCSCVLLDVYVSGILCFAIIVQIKSALRMAFFTCAGIPLAATTKSDVEDFFLGCGTPLEILCFHNRRLSAKGKLTCSIKFIDDEANALIIERWRIDCRIDPIKRFVQQFPDASVKEAVHLDMEMYKELDDRYTINKSAISSALERQNFAMERILTELGPNAWSTSPSYFVTCLRATSVFIETLVPIGILEALEQSIIADIENGVDNALERTRHIRDEIEMHFMRDLRDENTLLGSVIDSIQKLVNAETLPLPTISKGTLVGHKGLTTIFRLLQPLGPLILENSKHKPRGPKRRLVAVIAIGSEIRLNAVWMRNNLHEVLFSFGKAAPKGLRVKGERDRAASKWVVKLSGKKRFVPLRPEETKHVAYTAINSAFQKFAIAGAQLIGVIGTNRSYRLSPKLTLCKV